MGMGKSTNKYSGTPNGLDLQGLGTDVLANYSLTNMPKDPAEDDSRDLPLEGMTATAGSEQATTEVKDRHPLYWIRLQVRSGTANGAVMLVKISGSISLLERVRR